MNIKTIVNLSIIGIIKSKETSNIKVKKLPAVLKLRIRDSSARDELVSSISGQSKYGSKPSTNLRALRLALTLSDQLLSMGVPITSVVTRAMDITDAYCRQPVHIDVVSNVLIMSQLKSLEEEPLTLIRTINTRSVNNMTIQLLQDLAYHIKQDGISLNEAEKRLYNILRAPIVYPKWASSLANSLIASGVVMLFSTNWRLIVVTFLIVWLTNLVDSYLNRNQFAAFFRYALVASLVTLSAALLNWLAVNGFVFFKDMNPTIIIIGGIVMLLSGLAFVGAIQDAIEEYYVTANARIMQVLLLTGSIVLGVLIGMYLARKLGIGIAISPDPLVYSPPIFQILAGIVTAGAFALKTQTRLRAIIWASILGAISAITVYYIKQTGMSVVAAVGITALIVGYIAKKYSRMWRTPTSSASNAAIVPLVPGLAIYTALMQLVHYPPGDPSFYRGLGTAFTAIAIAVAIASGSTLGNLIARSPDQRRASLRNLLPLSSFNGHYINKLRGGKLMSLILNEDIHKKSDDNLPKS